MFLNLAQKTILILAEDAGLSPADLSRLFWLTDKDSRLSLRRVTRKLRPKMRREKPVSLAKLSMPLNSKGSTRHIQGIMSLIY